MSISPTCCDFFGASQGHLWRSCHNPYWISRRIEVLGMFPSLSSPPNCRWVERVNLCWRFWWQLLMLGETGHVPTQAIWPCGAGFSLFKEGWKVRGANNTKSTLFPSKPLPQCILKQSQETEQVPSLHSADLKPEVAGVRFTCPRSMAN